jgi:AAA+ ATPase superfamily predicted ATPase
MQVVIHIGTEKTGSTTLQEFMVLNRDVLLVNGVYVPQCLGRSNHRKLAVYCMSDSKLDDFIINNGLIKKRKRERFRQSVADALIKELGELDQTLVDTVLISSEHFHSRLTDISEVEQLKVLFASIGADVKVICYLRKQSHLVESKYSTFLKSRGMTASFASFSEECVESNRYYNYDLFLKLWEQCFSVENIRIREFSLNKFKENNLCLDFLGFAGLNVEEKELTFLEIRTCHFPP